ncbi:HNH endonuclease signature motif containing protein [Micromonospora sp. CPCC 206061]|uniref:HNH endonuclease signature motif containing protein n=1 Tax=Micromonospora sp. CPCC 206061 TaxID=3122410 RepID=UPI002FEF2BD8
MIDDRLRAGIAANRTTPAQRPHTANNHAKRSARAADNRAKHSLRTPLQLARARDGGCAFPGCDRPPRWCDAHHITAWTTGGTTALHNGVLLCGYHHRLIHRREWEVRLGADGRPEFTPPHYVDTERKPRRNLYHRRT